MADNALLAMISQGGNPTSPLPDLATIYGTAIKLKELKQQQETQNALRMIYANPANIGPDGFPTSNAMQLVAKASPGAYMDLVDKKAAADEKAAQTGAARSEEAIRRAQLGKDALGDALTQYDSDVASGVPADMALDKAKKNLHDFIFSQPINEAEKDRQWSFIGGLDGKGLRAASMTMEQKLAEQKEAREAEQARASRLKFGTDQSGRPVEYDPETGLSKPTPGGFRPYAGVAIEERERHDIAGEKLGQERINQGEERLKALLASGGQMTPDELTMFGTILAEGGQLPSLGMGGAAMRQAIFKRAAEIAKAEAGGDIGQAGTNVITRKADIRADTGELLQLRKMQGNVHSFIGLPAQRDSAGNITRPSTGAEGEADMVESLIDKGTSRLGPAFNKAWNQVRVQGFGDPDVVKLRNALLSLQQENAKIMQGSTGSVAAVSDQMSREIEKTLSGDFNPAQIRAAIPVMKQGWRNRAGGIDDEVRAAQAQIRGDTGHPASGTSPANRPAPPARLLQENVVSRMTNGERWTLRDGKPTYMGRWK